LLVSPAGATAEHAGLSALLSALQTSAAYNGEIATTNTKLKLLQARKVELETALQE